MIKIMNKKILVTGGAGYIGSHTLKLLAEQAYELWVYDDLSNGLESLLPSKAHFVKGDLQGPELEALFKNEKFDLVIHDAAKIDVNESMEDPYYYYHHNTVATLKLLRLMKEQQCQRLVFASTAAVYGYCKDLPVTENTPTVPTNHYGQSKLMAERMILAGKIYGLRSVIFRFFNVCGVDVELGRKLKTGHHLIGKIIKVLGGEQKKLSVFGNNCPSVDGSPARDFIDVRDIALGQVRATEALLANFEGGIFNLAVGQAYTVLQAIKTAEKISGRQCAYDFTEAREGEVPVIYADATKAKQFLNWQYKYSFEEMISSEWQWYLS